MDKLTGGIKLDREARSTDCEGEHKLCTKVNTEQSLGRVRLDCQHKYTQLIPNKWDFYWVQ